MAAASRQFSEIRTLENDRLNPLPGPDRPLGVSPRVGPDGRVAFVQVQERFKYIGPRLDLERYLRYYNTDRAHTGRWAKGRTPEQIREEEDVVG